MFLRQNLKTLLKILVKLRIRTISSISNLASILHRNGWRIPSSEPDRETYSRSVRTKDDKACSNQLHATTGTGNFNIIRCGTVNITCWQDLLFKDTPRVMLNCPSARYTVTIRQWIWLVHSSSSLSAPLISF